jgi:hypothetical protein
MTDLTQKNEELLRRFAALRERAKALIAERPDYPDTPEQRAELEAICRAMQEPQARAIASME